MKTLIDRCLACGSDLAEKEFYFIATAAAGKTAMECTIDGLRRFADCLPDSKAKGVIYGARAWQLGEFRKARYGRSLSDGQKHLLTEKI